MGLRVLLVVFGAVLAWMAWIASVGILLWKAVRTELEPGAQRESETSRRYQRLAWVTLVVGSVVVITTTMALMDLAASPS